MGWSSGGMEIEASSPVGDLGAKGGGEADQKILVGGVGWRVGIAREGVCCWELEIRW